ncbi:hypothetical protein SS50377_20026 [Spironucleus salmonicida]|uniref:Uncharacterized protein n=1 Tax=Spironucleus salmonicida TaxID=348837 RepID=V6LXX2_9EUKA|nr:hypothetical protein SS50377_20026 [Spironucleus salmonicida]|eukprot:EST49405.1 Hypothetical protein SS50377_10330 [Spironucleus salmonicida]
MDFKKCDEVVNIRLIQGLQGKFLPYNSTGDLKTEFATKFSARIKQRLYKEMDEDFNSITMSEPLNRNLQLYNSDVPRWLLDINQRKHTHVSLLDRKIKCK